MEDYINEKTIIKNDIYKSLKDNIYCPSCKKIMIEPVMCLGCQNTFCKNCLNKLNKKGKKCPNGCANPTITDVILKNNFITKLKFKCIKDCGKELSFDELINHYNSTCKKRKIKILDKKKVPFFKKKFFFFKKKVKHLTSTYYNINFFKIISFLL